MAAVMIGVDPHKGSHTAVAISPAEEPLGELQARASAGQAEKLIGWAAAWPERTWAVEGAAGLGRLLAQQLPPPASGSWMCSRSWRPCVRLLQAGDTNKNDPNDALSVAVAALRSTVCREVIADDYRVVLKVWSKRHRDLARLRNQVACRLHAVSATWSPAATRRRYPQLMPPGSWRRPRRPVPSRWPAPSSPPSSWPTCGTWMGSCATRKKLAAAVMASGTTLTQVFGVGPVIAGTVIGDVGDVARFPGRDHFASYNGTAPVEVSSGNGKIHRLSLRGNRRINHAIHMAAITQLRHKHSEGRAYYDKKVAQGKTHKEALRSLKRKVSDAIFARLQADARQARENGPGGQPGNGSDSSAASSHPERQLFGPPLPDLAPPYDPAPPQQAHLHRRSRLQRKLGQPLDSNSKEDSIWTAVQHRWHRSEQCNIGLSELSRGVRIAGLWIFGGERAGNPPTWAFRLRRRQG